MRSFFPGDVLPANFILDRQGRVTHFLRSYVNWDAEEAERMFRDLVERGESGIPGTARHD